ncbi:hypothetical protein ACFSCV_03790 [Methylopila henanensis]|uniref:Pentapeptide MXKDX repeat protein n=1 Tax=Methylopila henanensis TaxID=873516 RepID=A0ABW4K1X2_9HYPH
MKTFAAFALASALAVGAGPALAQTNSTVDQGANPAEKTAPDKAGSSGKMSPGTTGAMDNAVKGTATSKEDVKRQTEGGTTAADGAHGGKMDKDKHSPGATGATPGSDHNKK